MSEKGCIFDLDGVICHTDEFHYLAWKKLSDDIGLRFDRDMNSLLRGVSRKESFEIILRQNNRILSENVINEIIDKKNRLYRQYLEMMKPEDLEKDVVSVLRNLRENGVRVGLGSSSKNASFILEKLCITDEFDAVVDGNDIERSKPDPQVFILAADKLNVKPSDCFVVEDAVSGIQAGTSAGMKCISYRCSVDMKGFTVRRADNFEQIKEIVLNG